MSCSPIGPTLGDSAHGGDIMVHETAGQAVRIARGSTLDGQGARPALVEFEHSAYSPVMSELETALRRIIADVVREELQVILGHRGLQAEPLGERHYVSPAQAADIASVSTRTIHKWIRQGRLPASRPGRLVRVAIDDLHGCMAAKPPESSFSPEELADRIVAGQREQDKTRCPDCGHLPILHMRGGCRAKNCTCSRQMG